MVALTPTRTTHQVTLLPDPVLPSLARPLAVIGAHTYAAIWPYLSRGSSRRPLTRELILVRDDGQLLVSPRQSGDRQPGGRQSGARQPLPALDWFLPSHPPVPADRLWSGDAVQRYRDGHRPDPAAVFANLLAVLRQFVDFSGSLGPPDLMTEFFATYVLTTWFAPAFPFHGLLWLLGDNGAGKSRLLSLLARLAHLGLYLPVLPPPSALRSLASLGAVLAVDDAGFLGPRASQEQLFHTARYALLLAGRQRGAMLPVTLAQAGQPAGAHPSRQLDVSGPRLFASVHPPHPDIARFFIVIPLVRTALASLAAADPSDPAAWPADLSLTGLVDDLWALALSCLHDLPPHLPLAAQAAASSGPPHSHTPTPALPLLGASLQPWHALLATASWLSACGVAGLLERLLSLAQAYHAARPVPETADLSILCLQALLACVSDSYQRTINYRTQEAFAAYDRDHGLPANDDLDPDENDDATADDTNDAKSENSVLRYEQRLARDDWRRAFTSNPDRIHPPFPSSFPVTSAQILESMRLLAADLHPDLPLDFITTSVVGRLLRQLRLSPHRTANSRLWIITPAALARLARAYGVPIPLLLLPHFPSAPSFTESSSP